MSTNRTDETWHRLLEWTYGQAPSERLAAQVLLHEGFTQLDPSHPLGGRDGGQDAACQKDGRRWTMAVYFPRGQQEFRTIASKFNSDLCVAPLEVADGFAFVTNQELRLGERRALMDQRPGGVELYHLERLTAILDRPPMASVRSQFLGVDFSEASGGVGGSGTIVGDRGLVIGGRGGSGGTGGKGGDGGGGYIQGNDGMIVGGDGGNAGTPDGRGGRSPRSPGEVMNLPSVMWPYGRGGAGGNAPEYNRRLSLLATIRQEYLEAFPADAPFINAGVDPVPVAWVNKRLEELGETWRVEMGETGYLLPPLGGI